MTIGALFTLLSINLLADFMRTGRVTGLLLLVGESLVVVLTIVRRRARHRRSVRGRGGDDDALAGRPGAAARHRHAAPLAPDRVTAMVSALGLLLVVVGKMALGRSFGVVPANRGVVVRGPVHVACGTRSTPAISSPTSRSWSRTRRPGTSPSSSVADTALILRALMEERVLSADVDYQQYCRRVGWHLVPGVF